MLQFPTTGPLKYLRVCVRVCVCVCVCMHVCGVCACVCVYVCMYTPIIVPTDKILCFINTVIIIITTTY